MVLAVSYDTTEFNRAAFLNKKTAVGLYDGGQDWKSRLFGGAFCPLMKGTAVAGATQGLERRFFGGYTAVSLRRQRNGGIYFSKQKRANT